jgi:nickel transport protein
MPPEKTEREKPFRGAYFLMIVFCLTLAMANTPSALAHRVYLYAWVEGDTVYTESYFGSKKKVQGGLIQVFDVAGKKLLEGRTNNEGEFSFGPPEKKALRIVVDASMGHRGEYILEAEEFLDVAGSQPELSRNVEPEEPPSSTISSLDAEQIRTAVEQALDSRLKPILRELARSQKAKGPGAREAFAGIGYILGFMGLILYLRSRKK